MSTVQVLLPLPLPQTYTYSVDRPLAPGSFVHVSVGSRKTWGVVWNDGADTLSADRDLKPVLQVYDGWCLPVASQAFIRCVAHYTVASAGMVLKMVCPVLEAISPPAVTSLYGWSAESKTRLTPPRIRVREVLKTSELQTLEDLRSRCDVNPSVLRTMVRDQILTPQACAWPTGEEAFPRPIFQRNSILSQEQRKAADQVCERIQEPGFSATLLEGLTGSGKTEVYFEAVAKVLDRGQQVLVLLPEIALTVQWLQRFQERFGVAPAVWHGDLTPSVRRKTWAAAYRGGPRVIVGARSALFLPFSRLGLIIVDEEHDGSYKQEDGVTYHGRDMAVARASLGRIPIVLVSATPSLETLWNVKRGRYAHVQLTQRYQAQLPSIELIDMREVKKISQSWLSPRLREAIQGALEGKQQVLLYLNRRGYAPLVLCRSCGDRLACTRCSTWLVLHGGGQEGRGTNGTLHCHHCGQRRTFPRRCAVCETDEAYIPCGPGVERVAQEAATAFPQARIQVMSRDTLASPVQLREMMQAMEARQIDILVGTQMVAKGHHFPELTCVGVIDGDGGLGGCDLRACEKTYQLLSQVAGRAGRGAKPGRVFLQTFDPQHPVLQALVQGDAQDFLVQEMAAREANGLPPFGRLAAVVLSGAKLPVVQAAAHRLRMRAPVVPQVEVWGPVPAPLSLLRGRHRQRFLVKAPRNFPLQDFLRQWLQKGGAGIRVDVDIDPYTFL